MEFVMQRNRTVVGLGHAIAFEKGEPTYVPPEMYDLVAQAGGVSVDELPDEDDKPKLPVAPTDPNERAEAIQTAIKMLVERNGRDDFTAAGAPHLKVMAEILGFTIDAKERDVQWAAFQAAD